MPFHSEFSKPTAEHYQAIGRVAANWSLVETALEDILARLACAPTYLGRALTNDLGKDNQLTALRNLCDIHEDQLGCRIVPDTIIAQLRDGAKEIAAHKGMRNQIVHYVWIRDSDDRMSGFRFRSKPAPRSGGPNLSMTVGEVNQFADQVEDLSTRLLDLADHLPDVAWP